MKRFSVVALAALAVAVAFAVPASATPSTTETFSLLRAFPGGPPTTWSATGSFADSGAWRVDNLIAGGFPAPTEFAVNFFTTLSSPSGTISMRFLLEGNQSQAQDHCWIVRGTGAYTNLRGHGTFTLQIIGDRPHIDCTAAVHFD